MPDLDGYSSFEGTGNIPIALGDTSLLSNGRRMEYLYVKLPDPENDSAMLSLVNSYKPFALPLLEQWTQQEKKGVLIDLRSRQRGIACQTQYLLEQPGGFSVPVFFIWDGLSYYRMALCLETLQSIPSLRLNRIAGGGPMRGEGRNDCFQASPPCLNCQ